MNRLLPLSLACVLPLVPTALLAQVLPAPTGQPAPPAAPGPDSTRVATPTGITNPGAGAFGPTALFGGDWPALDPSTGYLEQNGRTTNLNDNQALRSQVTTFLAQHPPLLADAQQYQQLFQRMLALMDSRAEGGQNPNEAYGLLNQAAAFTDLDGDHSSNVSNAIFQAWLAKNSVGDLNRAEHDMQQEILRLERNLSILQQTTRLESGSQQANGQNGEPAPQPTAIVDARIASLTRQLAELQARRGVGQATSETSILAAKTEFQVTIGTLFLARRYQHCKLACAFYRYLFQDSNSTITLAEGSESSRLFSEGLGQSPTVNAVEIACTEAINKVRGAVAAFHDLVENNELYGASERVTEAVIIGEFMPEVQMISSEERRKVSRYLNQSARLIDQLQAKDYNGAEETLNELDQTATDFRYTAQVRSQIDAQRNASRLLMQQAQMAQLQGNSDEFIRLSGESFTTWPGNPQIAEISQGGVIQQRMQENINEFDRLYSAGDFRAIFAKAGDYGPAVNTDPVRKQQLNDIIADLTQVDATLAFAESAFSRGGAAAAWEVTEDLLQENPRDSATLEANRRYQQETSEFVAALRDGQKELNRDNLGSALSHFLAAQQEYPDSRFASEGIAAALNEVLPEQR